MALGRMGLVPPAGEIDETKLTKVALAYETNLKNVPPTDETNLKKVPPADESNLKKVPPPDETNVQHFVSHCTSFSLNPPLPPITFLPVAKIPTKCAAEDRCDMPNVPLLKPPCHECMQ